MVDEDEGSVEETVVSVVDETATSLMAIVGVDNSAGTNIGDSSVVGETWWVVFVTGTSVVEGTEVASVEVSDAAVSGGGVDSVAGSVGLT